MKRWLVALALLTGACAHAPPDTSDLTAMRAAYAQQLAEQTHTGQITPADARFKLAEMDSRIASEAADRASREQQERTMRGMALMQASQAMQQQQQAYQPRPMTTCTQQGVFLNCW